MKRRILFLFSLLLALPYNLPAEEGMYPVTELNRLNLKKIGIEIEAGAIFSENKVSLSDAIVKLGGCTGSFISPDGLILTNHHCAFGAIRNASTPQNDYLTNGFVAKTREQEFPAKGYTVRITEQVKDVSQDVLAAVNSISDPLQREKAIERKIKEIVQQQEKAHPGLRAEVAEMFPGKTYYLFLYTYLKDVRLVYAPPRSVGEFGGEIDNWEWPRHTGDFSLMRAYVAPDGSPASYSPQNVPYHPRTYLKINPQGVEEGDRVFILGYPGRTYRHRTSAFLEFEAQVRMPLTVDWYQWQISLMEKMGKNDPARKLKFSGRMKGLANVEKNYRGKLQGIRRTHLLDQKREEERQIQDFIKTNHLNQYRNTLQEIKELYKQYRQQYLQEWLLQQLPRSVNLFGIAFTLVKAATELQKPDLERESPYMNRNFERTKTFTLMRLKTFDPDLDQQILNALLHRVSNIKSKTLIRIFALDQSEQNTKQVIAEAFKQTRLSDSAFVQSCFSKSLKELQQLNDPILSWAFELQDDYETLKTVQRTRSGKLRALRTNWLEVKKKFLKTDFIPDANGTFRFTYGKIEGYSPADAVYKSPITSDRGILEKNTGNPPFNTPLEILQLLQKQSFGSFISKTIKRLPVNILYSTDTTGGNSGSPVLNARGELIGLNFDRTFEATINDFAYNSDYSRSIGVDIRYILFLLKYYAHAETLLEEMGIK